MMIEALILSMLVAGVFAAAMAISRTREDDGEPVVGVQRQGRTYFVRRGHLTGWIDQELPPSHGHHGDHLSRLLYVSGIALVTALAVLSVSHLS